MKPFTIIAIVVFACVTVLQFIRFVLGWPILINGIAVPLWASAIVFVFSALLAVMLWRENRR
ncbi:hypothetical protein [Shewanella salipaludis]|uniref:Uncharacterized protein n=1 Tax=Shewanella salipaludis TaxID=2723052 RepID=A0A972FSN2_9GAMM|nr:hypothetical protein [Shewanella salipaludis]NMH64991.1 hypothetical protein [Shewanella salipaludis]